MFKTSINFFISCIFVVVIFLFLKANTATAGTISSEIGLMGELSIVNFGKISKYCKMSFLNCIQSYVLTMFDSNNLIK